MGPLIGEDGVPRCPWAGSEPSLLRAYHDAEWGRPVTGETAHFERLSLEAFQSGLSWATILAKRPAFRDAFAGFDADAVARYDEDDVARLLGEERIVRNRRKIEATIGNARATVALRADGGLERLIAGFAPEHSPRAATTDEAPTASRESAALSKELKRRGFAFVGPTTMYALLEALGLLDPHLVGCHRRGSRR